MPWTVYIVEHDVECRRSIRSPLERTGYSLREFSYGATFLDETESLSRPPRCLLVDLNLPDIGGLEIQKRLKQQQLSIPIIMIVAEPDVRSIVEALQCGALDVLERPIKESKLLKATARAIEWDLHRAYSKASEDDYHLRLRTLSSRERELLDLTVSGKNSKQISSLLRIGVSTVLKHKSRMLAKMGVSNDVELTLLFTSIEGPQSPPSSHSLESASKQNPE